MGRLDEFLTTDEDWNTLLIVALGCTDRAAGRPDELGKAEEGRKPPINVAPVCTRLVSVELLFEGMVRGVGVERRLDEFMFICMKLPVPVTMTVEKRVGVGVEQMVLCQLGDSYGRLVAGIVFQGIVFQGRGNPGTL